MLPVVPQDLFRLSHNDLGVLPLTGMDRRIDYQLPGCAPAADAQTPDLPVIIGFPDALKSCPAGIFFDQGPQIPCHILIIIQLILTADDPRFLLNDDLYPNFIFL